MFKKILLYISFFIGGICSISFAVPLFDQNQGSHIGYNITVVNRHMSLSDNIRNLFFPDAGRNGGIVWEKLKYIAVGLLFIFLIWAGSLFVLNANDDGELKKAKSNILYIFYGAFLVFASVWLLGTILQVGQDTATADTAIIGTQRDIIGTILIFLKAMAYYIAVIMMIYYGYQIMQAQEKEDKIKAGKTGVLNIILALIAIKVLDYIYYIAQNSNFKDTAGNFLAGTGKILGWALGVLIIIAVLYAATLLITSRGNEEAWKKSKTIIRNVFLVIIIVFLFIVIIYDLIKNFSA